MEVNYIDLTDEQIIGLENQDISALAVAGLMILHGQRKGIISTDEAVKQAHNLFIAILAIGD